MKLVFTKTHHQLFKTLLNIKDFQSDIEIKYFEKTIRYIKYIKWIPGIKMVGIGNSLSMNSATKNSDIDLLIVTSQNTLWITRILTTLIFQIMGVRKNNKKHAGRFCLSFFCNEKAMNFGDFKIQNDIYLYFWIIYFKPILSYNNTYQNFIKTNEKWANFDDYKNIIENNKKYIKYKKNTKKGNIVSNKIIYFFEYTLKKIFLPRTLNKYNKLNKPYGIIINDNLLKFHNNDKREIIKNIIF